MEPGGSLHAGEIVVTSRITACRGDSGRQEDHCLQRRLLSPEESLLTGEIVSVRRITACMGGSGRQGDHSLRGR